MSGSFMARIGLAGFACGVILLYSLAVLPPLHWLISAMAVPLLLLTTARPPALRGSSIAVAAGLAGLLWACWHADTRLQATLPAALEGEELEVSGHLCGVPTTGSFNSVRFGFCVNQWHLPESLTVPPDRPLPGQLRLAWYGDEAKRQLPRQLRLRVVLKRPHGSVNPEGFRYESWLYRKGFGATGSIRDLAEDRGVGCGLGCQYHGWRSDLVQSASERLSAAEHFPLISSLMIGYRGHMESRHWEVLKATGTIHLVAISGLHLGLIAAGAGFVCRRVLLRLPESRLSPGRLRNLTFFGVCVASLAYALAAGFSVPTRRALIMVMVAGWVLLGARKAGAFDGLLIALFLVLLADPFSPLDQGFWLSFGAVSVLVLLFSLRLRGSGWLSGLLLAQLAVFAALWPILEVLGQSQALVGFAANLFAIPWVSLVVMPVLAVGALALVVLPGVDNLVITLFDLVFGVLWEGLAWLAEADVVMPGPGLPALLVLSVVVMVALVVPFGGFRLAALGVVGCWAALSLGRGEAGGAPNTPAEYPELWVWDVGQGLSVMVRDQDRVLVYDTGPALDGVYSAVDSVLIPNLRALGIRRVDTLVVSHGDSDHAGGLPLFLETFDVRSLITGEPRRVADLLPEGSSIKVDACAGQDSLTMGHFELSFWRTPDERDGNDASCVLTLRSVSSDLEVILPGDITARAERQFLSDRDGSPPGVYRIALAPHHGSKSSSSEPWIRELPSDLVIFSAGYRHRFGHPHPDVVGRYLSAGSQLLNTATSGAVHLVFRPDAVAVEQVRANTPFWIRKPENR